MLPQSWIDQSIGGRYQINSLLGSGGMSAVYQATDPNLRRMVAIKLIHPHLSVDPNFVNRFKEEAAAVARLRHPNIVQVHDFNVDGETYYMVMEYLVGETLQARLKRLNAARRLMPFTEVLNICTQLCDAVGYAHNHELIHRDIKPANIMLDVNHQAILMDFGIVKIIGGEYHTATGATVGTAMYMSPEQMRSERVDERSDIYSLGVTLYEMLAGHPPYQADTTVTLMMMVLNDPLPDLRKIREGIPENLVAVAEKALEKDKKNRFQTMEEMTAALQAAEMVAGNIAPAKTIVDDRMPDAVYLQETAIEESNQSSEIVTELETTIDSMEESLGESIKVSQPVVPEQVIEPAKRNYMRFMLITVVLLLLVVVFGGGYYLFSSQRIPNLQLVPINTPPTQITADNAKAIVSLGIWETGSYISELAYSPVDPLLGSANNREVLSFSQYDFYGSLIRVDSGELQNHLTGHPRWINSVAFSPDGQLFATASEDGNVRLWQVNEGSLIQEINTPSGDISDVDFSPNNLLLATASYGEVGLWQFIDNHLLRSLKGHEDSVTVAEFSPDGTLIASASDDQSITLWQVADGSLLYTLRGHTEPIRTLAFSPDGDLLASAAIDYTIRLWQVSDGSLVRTLEGHSEEVLDVAFSPDGSLIASASGDGTLRLWEVSDGSLLRILPEHDETVTSTVFSPDGHLLVSAAVDGSIRFWGISEAIPTEMGPSQ